MGTQIYKAQGKGLSVTVSNVSFLQGLKYSFHIKGIVLVGGLGCSDYLFESLVAKYDSQDIGIYRSEDKDQV